MRVLSVYRAPETGIPPTCEYIAEMGKLIEEMTNAGVLLATEGCMPSALGARVRLSEGRLTVTDGPFTESKELIAGFALLEAKSREEAIELGRRFLKVAGDGECEIRQIFSGPEAGPGISPEVGDTEERTRAQMAALRQSTSIT